MTKKYKVRKLSYTEDGRIDCEINHPKFGWTPFTVSDKDSEDLGKVLYRDINKGLYGEISEYKPTVVTEEVLAQSIRNERDNLLSELDQVIMNPLRWEDTPPLVKEEITAYRKNLLDIPQQEGFPLEVTYPSKPEALSQKSEKIKSS